MADTSSKSTKKSNKGFASPKYSAEKQRQVASMGGRAAHEKGNAHEFDSDEAREAGRKGGRVTSTDREHMARIGQKGGERSGSSSSAPE